MDTHAWMFPWFALIAALAVFLLSAIRSGRILRRESGSGLARSFVVVWLLALAAAAWAELRLGRMSGIDVIPTRGLLLGALGGAILVFLSARCCSNSGAGTPGEEAPASTPGDQVSANSGQLSVTSDQSPAVSDKSPLTSLTSLTSHPHTHTPSHPHTHTLSHPHYHTVPLLLGFSTAMIAAARLWLTHGEISGLTALMLGTALSVLCLGIAPAAVRVPEAEEQADFVLHSSTLALLYVVCLACTVELGFTRAANRHDMIWADFPLLLGAALAVGALISAGIARLVGPSSILNLGPPLFAGALVGAIFSKGILHNWMAAELLGSGAVVFGLLVLASRSGSLSLVVPAGDRSGHEDPAAVVGFLTILVASLVAFQTWAGHGLGLLALGGWSIAAWSLLQLPTREIPSGIGITGEPVPDPPSTIQNPGSGLTAAYGFSFVAVLLLHRLLILRGGSELRMDGTGDSWDMLAIGMGAVLPLAVAAWIRLKRDFSGAPAWAVEVEWLVALAAPILLTGYIWGGRFMSGALFGGALAQLLAGLTGPGRRRFGVVAVTGISIGLVLLQFLPFIQEAASPSKGLRIGLVLTCAALAWLRLLANPGFILGRFNKFH